MKGKELVKLRITHRLFLVILVAAILTVLSMFIIMQWSVERGFRRYINNVEQAQFTRLAVRLVASYAEQGSWSSLKSEPEQWFRFIMETFQDGHPKPPDEHMQDDPPPEPREPGPRPFPPGPQDPRRHGIDKLFILLDANKQPVFAPPVIPVDVQFKQLQYRNRTVGYLGMLPHRRFPNDMQRRFLKDTESVLILMTGTIVLLAAGLSFPLAGRLVRPIKALVAATDKLAAGEYSTRVTVASSDELGQLARGFNSLAFTLEKNEQTRQQWVADISHELRTPLAILRGEVEAIQDGVRPANTGSIDSLHCEVMRLERLVNDLYQLSLSDLGALTYRKEELDLEPHLSSAFASYRHQFAARGIAMKVEIPLDGNAVVFGDPERMRQLFANLFDNALKYTDPGGTIAVRLSCHDGHVVIDIEDSAPGVPDSELGRLFERLYRVEASRNRATGGAGLGLAICRNIVEAHDGTIEARHSTLGGLWINVGLPLTRRC